MLWPGIFRTKLLFRRKAVFKLTVKKMRKNSFGFTIIEVVMVLGLLAMISGLVIINANAIFRGFEERPLPDILRKVVRDARFQAAKNREPVFLDFDVEKSEFHISNRENNVLQAIPTGYPVDDPDLEIIFYQILPERGTSSFRNFSPNRKKTTYLIFHPDRSSTPFEVELNYDEERSVHRFDPFSDTEIDFSTL